MGVTKEAAPVVLRRQNIIIKINRFLPESEVQKIKQGIMRQLEDGGIAVIGCGIDVITVNADVIADWIGEQDG